MKCLSKFGFRTHRCIKISLINVDGIEEAHGLSPEMPTELAWRARACCHRAK